MKSEKIFDLAKIAELNEPDIKSKKSTGKYGVGERTIRGSLKKQGVKMQKTGINPKNK